MVLAVIDDCVLSKLTKLSLVKLDVLAIFLIDMDVGRPFHMGVLPYIKNLVEDYVSSSFNKGPICVKSLEAFIKF